MVIEKNSVTSRKKDESIQFNVRLHSWEILDHGGLGFSTCTQILLLGAYFYER